MADIHVALKDNNSVASAIFENSTSPGVILRGQIDQITGRILVDLVGGSGGSGYQAPLSGTVDGTNTIFVWATAPKAIVVDQGRTMQATNSTPDSSANWTGTTTTTLAIAPTFDIFAVA
jgi:hypothetical protein